MPEPIVKRGVKSHVRGRTKSGKWRKKRSDAGKTRDKAVPAETEARKTQVYPSEGVHPEETTITKKITIRKLIVRCEDTQCLRSEDGFCRGKDGELHLGISFGRSTDYIHTFICEDKENEPQ